MTQPSVFALGATILVDFLRSAAQTAKATAR
jgi:hypothetical protein